MIELEPSEDHPMQEDKPVDLPKESKEWKMPEIQMIDTTTQQKILLSPKTSFDVLISSASNVLLNADENLLQTKDEESKEFIKKLLEEDELALANLKEQREAESVFICKICFE